MRQIQWIVLTVALLITTAAFAQNMEPNTDRAGGDYRDFDLDRPSPALCQSACAREGSCKAWTYVKPGVQGDKARCWLKSEVPDPYQNDCCTSGVKGGGGTGGTGRGGGGGTGGGGAAGMERATDRSGSDYRDFDLDRPSPALCQSACANEGECRAWTYVKPGVQGEKARCWLKNEVPDPYQNDCCTSGVKGSGGGGTTGRGGTGGTGRGGGGGTAGMELATDRSGSDYRDFDLDRPSPALCQSACSREAECKAWTYVKPGVQGDSARCWLKSAAPDPAQNDCCVSGLKRGDTTRRP